MTTKRPRSPSILQEEPPPTNKHPARATPGPSQSVHDEQRDPSALYLVTEDPIPGDEIPPEIAWNQMNPDVPFPLSQASYAVLGHPQSPSQDDRRNLSSLQNSSGGARNPGAKPEEYLSFLEELFGSRETVQRPNYFEEDEDPDYNPNEEDEDFEGHTETEEYRRDRGVQVSKAEIEHLARSRMQNTSFPVGHPHGQAGQLISQPPPAMLPADNSADTDIITATGEVTKPVMRPLLPLGQNVPATTAVGRAEEGRYRIHLLNTSHFDRLERLMSCHAYLMVQTLVRAAAVGSEDIISRMWKRLQDLKRHRDATMEVKNSTNTLPDQAQETHNTFFNIPLLSQLPVLEPLVMAFRTNRGADFDVSKDNLNRLLAHFKDYAGDSLRSEIGVQDSSKGSGKLKFTPAEDRLLALGLKKFGPRDFAAIQSAMLPSKTPPQLLHRYKNRSSAKASNNPLKEYKAAYKVAKSQKRLVDDILMERRDVIHNQHVPHPTPPLEQPLRMLTPIAPPYGSWKQQFPPPTLAPPDQISELDAMYRQNSNPYYPRPGSSSLSSGEVLSKGMQPMEEESLDSSEDDIEEISEPFPHDGNYLASQSSEPETSLSSLLVPSYLSQRNNNTKGSPEERFEQDTLSESDEELECSDSPVVLSQTTTRSENAPRQSSNTVSWKPMEDREILRVAQNNKIAELPNAWKELSKNTGKSFDAIQARHYQLLAKLSSAFPASMRSS